MVDGFCTRANDVPYPIIVSDMKEEACFKLKSKYPDRVTAAASLQECVDKSDWVVIAVWPQAGEQVVRSLKFRPNHKVINVMFDKTIEQIKPWMNCEVDTMLHMIPGTFLSFYHGPIVQCPPTKEAAEIFGHIGNIVNVDSRYHAAAFGTITALLAPDYINGLTLLGGEPFEPENQRALLPFLQHVRAALPGKTVWAFTGFTWEQLHTDGAHPRCEVTDELLSLVDVLVDGRFVEELHDISLRFRGSSNQRIIDVPRTLSNGGITLWEDQ